jgi:hypothetical protein
LSRAIRHEETQVAVGPTHRTTLPSGRPAGLARIAISQRGTTFALFRFAAIIVTSTAVRTGPLHWGGEETAHRLLFSAPGLAAKVHDVLGGK